ncbi:efflux RND transporter periplasmic adaptor subunit [Candidatus Magnetaquicoccus inordinatus]|uniref:efflux RND transporter periplasmic adaptor subunit n=1 Tax=Candidatus Magnetaquicoccus inordinatus TaxID=2496818 RepID=UPI00102C7143|nr:efflux RND transporter periplasmic adaptor subunit [Candidatus Magnetaquicoccus inordinatus]
MRHTLFLTLLSALFPCSSVWSEEAMVEIHAQLVPKRYTTLSAEIAGRIESLTVQEGSRFKEGQTLASMDCALQRSQLDEARATVAVADKTRSVQKRLLQLNSGGVLEAEMAAAEAEKARARWHSSQILVGKCALVAPFPGRVVEQKVREHQYVQAGQALLDILDDSSMELEFIAPSSYFSALRPGSPFQIHVLETGKSYPAQITRLGAKVDSVSHTIKVVGVLNTANPELLAGMSGRVQLSPPAEKTASSAAP